MKPIILVTVLSTLFIVQPTVAVENAKPNIIYFLADDMGYGDVGFNGCKDIKTPPFGYVSERRRDLGLPLRPTGLFAYTGVSDDGSLS